MNILLEYLIVFIGVLIVNFFIERFRKRNMAKGVLPPELLYLKKIYHVDVKKLDRGKMSWVVIFINTFIITTIYIILMYLISNWVARAIIGIILLILMIIICYGFLGRYYLKKEGR